MLKFHKTVFVFLYVLLLSWSVSAAGTARPTAVGAVLGDPTGFTLKYLLSPDRYIDAVLAYNTGSATGIYLRGNYIVEYPRFRTLDGLPMNWYYGIGGRIYSRTNAKDENKTYLGPECLIGTGIFTPRIPIEIYIEAGLVMNITPSTSADMDAGVGIRYWF